MWIGIWIRIRIRNTDPDPQTENNPDPDSNLDPHHWFYYYCKFYLRSNLICFNSIVLLYCNLYELCSFEDVRVDKVTLRDFKSHILVLYNRILFPHKPLHIIYVIIYVLCIVFYDKSI